MVNKSILFESYGDNKGGVGRSLETFVKEIKEEVDILILGEYKGFSYNFSNNNLIFIEQIKFKFLINLLLKLKIVLRVLSYLLKIDYSILNAKIKSKKYKPVSNKYDVLICFSNSNLIYEYSSRVKLNKKISVIHTVFNANMFKRKNNIKYYKKYFKSNNELIFDSNYAKDVFTTFFGSLCRYRVIYPIINIENLRNSINKEIHSNIKDKLKLYCVSRLDIYDKGLDILLKVVLYLKELNYDVILKIAGHGPDFANMINMITKLNLRENVILLGNLENSFEYCSYEDTYIQLSRFEAYGITIDEAIYYNLNTIVTGLPSILERYKSNKKNIFVNLDIEEIVDKIIYINSSQNLQYDSNINIKNLIEMISKSKSQIGDFINEYKN